MLTTNFYKVLAQLVSTYNFTYTSYNDLINSNGETDLIYIAIYESSKVYIPSIEFTSTTNINSGGVQNAFRPSLYEITNGTTAYYGSSSGTIVGRGGVYIGTGTTQPTINDYALSGSTITTFSATTAVTTTVTSTGLNMVGTYNITNTGSAAFTVNEVGLFCGASSDKVMFDHTVLTTPLTIPAGDTKTLVYRISFAGSSAS